MKSKTYFFVLTFLFSVFHVFITEAQEAVVPLRTNDVLKAERLKHRETLKTITAICDTNPISLPFIDDFSAEGIYPHPCLWADSNVFINDDFPVNSLSIGVATFDGVDLVGNPYNLSSTSFGVADYLTSKPIDLSSPNDVDVWMSFFYQPQGLGYSLQLRDSLVLEFYDSSNTWRSVWRAQGAALAPFKQVMIKVTDTLYNYLYKGFRFRFKNYASLCGMLDQWNVDYVQLDKNRSASDTVITNDIAFVSRSLSTLKKYQSIPYPHYRNSPSVAMDTSKNVVLRNLDTVAAGGNHITEFLLDNFLIDYSTGPTAISIGPSSDTSSQKSFPSYQFPVVTTQDSLLCYVRNVKTVSDNNSSNDTLLEKQELYNYYAYDDGTAEGGYGLSVAGGKIAYRFDILMQDTLRAIQMRFVHADQDVHLSLFNISMWSNLNAVETVLLYSQHPQYSDDHDSINAFHTYVLDSPIELQPGTYYFGWSQIDATLLRLGIDKNINSNTNMFYNVTGSWQNSSIAGSWMIRPVFGKALPPLVSIGVELTDESIISVYPNPASDFLTVKNNTPAGEKLFFRMFDVTARTISESEVNGQQLNVSGLSNGVYQLVFSGSDSRTIASRKVVISR